jgi:hypothetical protein
LVGRWNKQWPGLGSPGLDQSNGNNGRKNRLDAEQSFLHDCIYYIAMYSEYCPYCNRAAQEILVLNL